MFFCVGVKITIEHIPARYVGYQTIDTRDDTFIRINSDVKESLDVYSK